MAANRRDIGLLFVPVEEQSSRSELLNSRSVWAMFRLKPGKPVCLCVCDEPKLNYSFMINRIGVFIAQCTGIIVWLILDASK